MSTKPSLLKNYINVNYYVIIRVSLNRLILSVIGERQQNAHMYQTLTVSCCTVICKAPNNLLQNYLRVLECGR